MYEMKKTKTELRREYTTLRKAVPPDEKKSMEDKIFKTFLSLVTYRYAKTLLLYYPKIIEVDTLPIITEALRQRKKVALPRCFTDSSAMDFYYINSVDELTDGAYNIPEPPDNAEKYDVQSDNSSTVMIVPALAFDVHGFRLGYGKGYYDRYLTRYKGTKIGLAYSKFVVESLPRGRYDMAVDFIVTDKGVKFIDKT